MCSVSAGDQSEDVALGAVTPRNTSAIVGPRRIRMLPVRDPIARDQWIRPNLGLPDQRECSIGNAADPFQGKLRIRFQVTNRALDVTRESPIEPGNGDLPETQLQQVPNVSFESVSGA